MTLQTSLYFKKIWFLYFITNAFALNGDLMLKNLGERQYLRIQEKSTSPYHGPCWHHALKAAKSSCDKLNDNEHTLLALLLSNCFLEDSGHITYSCHTIDDQSLRRECINQMSDRAFSAYNEFYIHATQICFYLNHEVRQAQTHETIKNLYEASTLMKEQLLEASQVQDTMLKSQKEGLKIQNKLLDNGKELENIIQTSSNSVVNMVSNFQESIKDQKELLFQIFSYLKTFQNWIISEVSWFQSIIYYTVSCILAALFSASKKTANARIVLFVTLSFNVIIERIIVQYYNNISSQISESKVDVVYSTWVVRRAALGFCFITLLYTYLSYRDENFENFKVLKQIESRLNSLEIIDSNSIAVPTIRHSRRLAIKRLKNSSNGIENNSLEIENNSINND